MKIWSYISVLALILCSSCREASTLFGYDAVVKVGHSILTNTDIDAAVPNGLTGSDSVSYVESYIDRWVIRQLKLQEAELIFSSSEADIDRMVEEYRQSLLIRKIENYYLERDTAFEVSDDDIEAYYNAHKSEFKLSQPVVKGYIVFVPEKYRRRDWLVQMFRSGSADKFAEAEQVCLKSNFRLSQFTEWTDAQEFMSYLPLPRAEKYDKYLDNRNLQNIHYDSSYCYFKVSDMLRAGEVMPLLMARDKIVRILTNRRQGEVIRSNEERMLRNAEYNGQIKFYVDTLSTNIEK